MPGPPLPAPDPGAAAERYRALVEAVAHDVWRASPQGALLTDVPRWRATTGQTEQEVLGAGWLEAVHPDDAERAERAWSAALAARGPYEVEYRICRVGAWDDEQQCRSLLARGAPVLDADGDVVEYVGLTIDVTERLREVRETQLLADRLRVAGERLQAVQAATAALSRAVTTTDVAREVLAQADASLACSGGGVSLVDETGTRLRYEVLEGYPTDVKATWRDVSLRVHSPGTHVLRTGEPLYLSGPEALLSAFPSADIVQFVEASQERSWVRVPLAADGQVFGVLSLGWREERQWDAEDRAFLAALAGLAAQALGRAGAYQRERAHSLELQRSLLPTALPQLEGITLRAEQRPGTAGLSVGGDWCDAFRVDDARVGLVVGDVRGKGAPAAAVMGRLRGALRAYAVLDPSPARVLERLDRFLLAEDDPEEIATLTYAVVTPGTGEVELASAGHLPALLVRRGDCSLVEAGAGGLPLGVQAGERASASLLLEPHDLLVLVTDGLLDERALALGDGLEALRQQVAAAAGDPSALVEALLAGAERAADDVTVLVARRGTAPDVRSELLVLEEDLRSAAVARRHVAAVLTEWWEGRQEDLRDDVLLLVSELVTNAVVHGRSGPTLELQEQHGELLVEVHDGAGDVLPRPRDADEEATNGRGLALLEELSSAWGMRAESDGRKTVWFRVASGGGGSG